jgi:hypothetical protein
MTECKDQLSMVSSSEDVEEWIPESLNPTNN